MPHNHDDANGSYPPPPPYVQRLREEIREIETRFDARLVEHKAEQEEAANRRSVDTGHALILVEASVSQLGRELHGTNRAVNELRLSFEKRMDRTSRMLETLLAAAKLPVPE